MSSFTKIYKDLIYNGKMVEPRGMKTLEIENYVATFYPYERFCNFPSRKLSLNYIKDELQWYLKGDLEDLSICDKAKIWKDCITDGKINSNYGHYIFVDKQIDYVVECLKKDPDSRRAVISILSAKHLYMENKDVPCTVSLSFKIRNGQLNGCAHMRSSDAIYGYGNDVPFFSFVQECVYAYLKDSEQFKSLVLGQLSIFSESLHVYEKHWPMLEKLAEETVSPIDCPLLHSGEEVDFLRGKGQSDVEFQFTAWLRKRT